MNIYIGDETVASQRLPIFQSPMQKDSEMEAVNSALVSTCTLVFFIFEPVVALARPMAIARAIMFMLFVLSLNGRTS